MYHPKTDLERELFPNLGTARVVGGASKSDIGRIGTIIQKDEEVVRIAFPSFWDRPDDIDIDIIDDNTWCFTGEYEIIND